MAGIFPQPCATHAVLIETSIGSIVVDLFGADYPAAVAQFTALCAVKYFNGFVATECVPQNSITFSHVGVGLQQESAVASLLRETTVQLPEASGEDPPNEVLKARHGGLQLVGGLAGPERPGAPLPNTLLPRAGPSSRLRIQRKGLLLVSFPRSGGSGLLYAPSFTLTLSSRNMDYLESRYIVIGEVAEGDASLAKLLTASIACTPIISREANSRWRPLRLVHVKHLTVLDGGKIVRHRLAAANGHRYCCLLGPRHSLGIARANRSLVKLVTSERSPFLTVPPSGVANDGDILSIDYDEAFHGEYLSSEEDSDRDGEDGKRVTAGRNMQEKQLRLDLHQAKANETRALMLRLLDGHADASSGVDEIHPPENVLFVCKLNPDTTSEGLATCFSQFGEVVAADVVRDRVSQRSLRYAFIEFSSVEACNRAYRKMDNVIIDDCRIHVDFSQSVSKLWAQRTSSHKRARA